MRQAATPLLSLLVAIVLSFGFSLSQDDGQIHLKINKDENGKKSVFEKTYANMNELREDEDLKKFDVLVDKWASEKDHIHVHSSESDGDGTHKIVIRKKSGDTETIDWTSDVDVDTDVHTEVITDGNKHIIIKEFEDDDDGNVKKEKVIKIKKGDGEQEFTFKVDGDGESTGVWMDKDGNVTTFSDEDVEKMIKEHAGEGAEIHKRIEVISSDGDDGEEQVFIMKRESGEQTEIKVDVEKEVGEDGKERVISKNVWVTKDGKTVELKDENDFHFESDGDKMTIKVDGKTIDIDDLSGGEMEGKHIMALRSDSDEDGDSQTMDISIEEKDGDKYIEIDIKRSSKLTVMISDIMNGDATLDDVEFSLKNNLKPSQLSYYPNPSNGVFNLNFTLEKKGEATVKVIDILGNDVYSEKILDFDGRYDNEIDLTGKEKGIYVLQIIQNKKTLSRKILIE